MNPYIHLERIEVLVTLQCSSNCKHCSIGARLNERGSKCIDTDKVREAIEYLAGRYEIRSLMTFGGEPLLYWKTACKIHETARNKGIMKRQLITNGYFTKNVKVLEQAVHNLSESGVNDILLSVDAFHQEKIPVERVEAFIKEIKKWQIPNLRMHPAWVVSEEADNTYNRNTRDILEMLKEYQLPVTTGNIIFPAGNAVTYLKDFYVNELTINSSPLCGSIPYTEALNDVRTLSFEPDGAVKVCAFTIGNIYEESIEEILIRYNPYENPNMKALLKEGVCGILTIAEKQGLQILTEDCYSECSVCKKAVSELEHLMN